MMTGRMYSMIRFHYECEDKDELNVSASFRHTFFEKLFSYLKTFISLLLYPVERPYKMTGAGAWPEISQRTSANFNVYAVSCHVPY